MVDYQKAKIYRIVNDINGMCYYGSTTQTLSMRMSKHRWSLKNLTRKTYLKFGEITDCKIFLVENYPCENKEQLLKRERFFVENNSCVNKQMPGRSIPESKAFYRLNNKDKINKKSSCDCGGKFTCGNKSKHVKTTKHILYIENKSNQ